MNPNYVVQDSALGTGKYIDENARFLSFSNCQSWGKIDTINTQLETTLAAGIHNGGSEGEQWHCRGMSMSASVWGIHRGIPLQGFEGRVGVCSLDKLGKAFWAERAVYAKALK